MVNWLKHPNKDPAPGVSRGGLSLPSGAMQAAPLDALDSAAALCHQQCSCAGCRPCRRTDSIPCKICGGCDAVRLNAVRRDDLRRGMNLTDRRHSYRLRLIK